MIAPTITDKRVLDRFSRFRKSSILRDPDGTEYLETFPVPKIPERADDVYHEVNSGQEGRLDLISYHYYGTAELWWVLAVANDLFFPMEEVTAGLVLRVPSSDYVFGELVS